MFKATAANVQTLLVSGRKKKAMIFAQEGHMWGPALVLAAELGDQIQDTEVISKLAKFVFDQANEGDTL